MSFLDQYLDKNLPPPEQPETKLNERERQRQYAMAVLTEHKSAFQQAFGSPAGQLVLKDLKRYCRAMTTCVVTGDRDQTLVLEGRREVWLLIQHYLDFTPEQLFELYVGPQPEGAISHD